MGRPGRQAALATLSSPPARPVLRTPHPIHTPNCQHSTGHRTHTHVFTLLLLTGPAPEASPLPPGSSPWLLAPPPLPDPRLISAGRGLPFHGDPAGLSLESTGHIRWSVGGLNVHWRSCSASSGLCYPCPPTPCPQAPARRSPTPLASCSYHGEAHVCFLERRAVVGAIPCHGYHLPLLGVRAVDDTCGQARCVLRALGCSVGRGSWPVLILRRSLGCMASCLALTLSPPSLWLFPAPGSPVAPSTCRGLGHLSLMLWACSPHRHPFFSLQPMATPAATMARIASPLLELQGPLCSPGARVLLGVYHVLTPHLLWEVYSHLRRSGLCHLQITLYPLFWPSPLSRCSSSIKSSTNNRMNG